jgi:hypothetical protein
MITPGNKSHKKPMKRVDTQCLINQIPAMDVPEYSGFNFGLLEALDATSRRAVR